jgi:nucleoside-diphosphate-sugar epimerase
MNILVTGGAGNVGKGVVAHLIQQEHQVRVIDRKIEGKQDGVEYAACDITDYDVVREQVRGMQGIIHLAAYPYPGAAPGPELFRVNATGTYNVFEAAAAEGIRRVTCASSINAFGFNFGVKEFPIHYFPIDEAHPTFTSDPYSFSKGITEEIAAYYWRRDEISSTCLRMPWVYSITPEWVDMGKTFLQQYEAGMREFLALPTAEQAQRVQAFKADLVKQRALRLAEKPFAPDGHNEEEYQDPSLMVFFGYSDFWAVISVDDTARAFEQSLLAEYEGSHPLFIAERENSTGIDSEALLRILFPEVTTRRRSIAGNSSIISYDKARDLIGFEPRYILRERMQ